MADVERDKPPIETMLGLFGSSGLARSEPELSHIRFCSALITSYLHPYPLAPPHILLETEAELGVDLIEYLRTSNILLRLSSHSRPCSNQLAPSMVESVLQRKEASLTRSFSIVLKHALAVGIGSIHPDVSVISLPRHLYPDECFHSPRHIETDPVVMHLDVDTLAFGCTLQFPMRAYS